MAVKRLVTMGICIVMAVLFVIVPCSTLAESNQPGISLCYTDTLYVRSALSISNGVANCYGAVCPSGKQDCSVTVTLYKKSGTRWSYITSWSASASGGRYASVTKEYSVSAGTYKVTATGNVAGEVTSATTSSKTCP